MDLGIIVNSLPATVFTLVIEHLVVTIGIYKAIRLRLVNKAFNSEILFAICDKQVVDIDDPATLSISLMPPVLKARVFLARYHKGKFNNYVSTIASVNKAMDLLTQPTEKDRHVQHQMVAEAICNMHPEKLESPLVPYNIPPDAEAQNTLSAAIVLGNLPLVKPLLEAPDALAGVNFDSIYFGRPLQLAAVWGHLHLVQYLLDRGADPRANTYSSEDNGDLDWDPDGPRSIHEPRRYNRNPTGSALRAAATGGHEDIVNLLLKPEYRLSTSKEEYFRAITAAGRGGYVNICQRLIALTGKPLNKLQRLREEMFWEATYHGQEEVMQMILDTGLDINVEPSQRPWLYGSALAIAAAMGNIHRVQFLLDRGALVRSSRECPDPVRCAVSHGHLEVVELLLENGGNVEDMLRSAVLGGQLHMVKWFLERDPGLIARKRNQEDTMGVDALVCAIKVKNPDIVRLLVDAGVSFGEGFDTRRLIADYLRSSRWMVGFLISLGVIGPIIYEDYQWVSEEERIRSQIIRGRFLPLFWKHRWDQEACTPVDLHRLYMAI
ncbi:ankyrin repeat-containing domain protein [Daldinia sp. FL1419]|nr:ankyrin repeat-containing domain protein [Daldinia sp. FL1419]